MNFQENNRNTIERLERENAELKKNIESYREAIEEIKNGAQERGVVVAGDFEGRYTIQKINGGETIIPLAENLGNARLKTGTEVVLNDHMIIGIVPEQLVPVKPIVEFERISWESIGGIKSQVQRIRESIELPLNNKDLYAEYNLKAPKGLLLYGAPGCGKTMIAKAIASYILPEDAVEEDAFIYMKGGSMLSKYVGEAENNIKNAFERARKYSVGDKKSIIFIDEAEAIMPTRGSRKSSDVETTIVPTFLSEMDGFEDNNIFIILATNHPSAIDPAIIRAGRIDIHIEVSRPDVADSADIFSIYLSKTKVVNDNVELLAEKSAKIFHEMASDRIISGATINSIVQTACTIAIKRNIAGDKVKGITEKDIQDAINIITQQ